MTFSIKKIKQSEGTGRYTERTHEHIMRHFNLYLVLEDGHRIDSFLKYRNAQAKIRRLKDAVRRGILA